MSLNKIEFLEEIKSELVNQKIGEIELFSSKKKTQFPLVVINYGVIRQENSAIDSSRKIKYIVAPIVIEIYTKEIKTCYEIEQKIIDCIQNSKKLKNLQLENSMQIPNLDKSIYRWRISYNATINYENNGII